MKSYSAFTSLYFNRFSMVFAPRKNSYRPRKAAAPTARGFFVPQEAMAKRELNVGTASQGGVNVATNLMAGEFIDGIAEDRDIAPVNKKDKKKTAEEKNRFWLELKGYQRMKAAEGKIISDGYLSHTYKDWCGVFPRNMPIGTLAPSVTTLNYIKHKQIRFAKGSKYAHRRSS